MAIFHDVSTILLYIGFGLIIVSAFVWNIYFRRRPTQKYIIVIDIWLLFVSGFYVCALGHFIPNQWLNIWSTAIRLYTTTALLFIGLAMLKVDKNDTN